LYIDRNTHGLLTEVYLTLKLLDDLRGIILSKISTLSIKNLVNYDSLTELIYTLLKAMEKLSKFVSAIEVGLFGKLKTK